MNINSNFGIGGLYNTLLQGNLAMQSNKLNRSLFPFPNNNGSGQGALGAGGVQYVNNIKSASKELGGAIRELSGSAFSQRTMTSSDTDIMSVKFSGNRPNSVSPMSVKIDQTAAGQLNEGARMTASASFQGSRGTNRFTIESGGKSTQLSVNVSATDSNKDVQQKMADAINKAGIGVKASVETDSATNASILRIESTTTGSDPKNGFSIKDFTGDLVARTGANDISRQGQDAIFSVNGGPIRTSQSNTVNLGNGVSATFNKASEQAVTISQGRDMDYAKSALQSMVNSYNDLYSEAVQRTGDPKAQNLASRMVSISKTYSGSLSDLGIGFDSSGRMTIDSKKLDAAADSGRLERFFTENSGKNFGFTNQISRLADNVSRNTSSFVSSSMFGSNLSENFSYSSLGSLMQFNHLRVGSLLDFMF